jgi:recombination protein RecA
MTTTKNKARDNKVKASADEQKAEALAAFIGDMGKDLPGVVMNLDDPIDVIPSGIIGLDIATGAGGFPRGRIVEFFGGEGGGKTTVALTVAAYAQTLGGTVGFIDAENGLNPELCRIMHIDPTKFVIYQPQWGEDAIEMVEKMMNSKAFDVIVLDSVAAMIPQAEVEAEVSQQHMALQARLMSKFMRRIAPLANKTGVSLILVNQLRADLGKYGTPDVTPGGRGIKFASSMRVEFKTLGKNKIMKGKQQIGHTIIATIKKNRLGGPFRVAEFDLIYGKGIDTIGNLIEVAVEHGILTKAAAFYTEVATGETLSELDESGTYRKLNGKDAVKKMLRENPAVQERLIKGVYDAVAEAKRAWQAEGASLITDLIVEEGDADTEVEVESE